MRPRLSILICHLPERADLLGELFSCLAPQMNAHPGLVECLVDDAPRGVTTTGEKRNNLLTKARGEYAAFIDDDDLVSPDYLERICPLLYCDVDVVGMEGVMTTNGVNPRRFIHSRKYDHWFSEGVGNATVYYRCPNHLNPVKAALARKVGFPKLNNKEDQDYSSRLYPLLKTEMMLGAPPIYVYRYRTPFVRGVV